MFDFIACNQPVTADCRLSRIDARPAIDGRIMKSWLKSFSDVVVATWNLRPHLRGGRYLLAAVMVSSMAGALFEGIGVSLLVPLLSLLLGGESGVPMRPIRWLQSWQPDRSPAFYVFCFCAIVLAAIALKNATIYGSQVLAARLRRRINVNLRQSVFERFHSADLQLFEQSAGGHLTNALFTETNRAVGMVEFLLLLWQRAVIGFFYFILLVAISWPLTLLALALAATTGRLIRFIHRALARSGREITEANQAMSACAMQSFAGIRVVRNTNSQLREVEKFRALNENQCAIEEKVARSSILLAPITETVAVAGAMTIVGVAYYFLVRPGTMLSSHLLGFGFILIRLLPLINQLYALTGHVLYLGDGVREVHRWLESPVHPRRPFGLIHFAEPRDSIRFENVSYTYPNGTKALSNVTFTIPAGKTVALVGASGSGKTTIASLLLRFREAESGRIAVDNQDLWSFSSESWHRALGVVEQEAFLFHDTLARNIGYGYEAVTSAGIDAAVRAAQLADVVNALPDGVNTVVGERGTMLSGGQRQRLAIARALVRNPKILILDEATSALDTISERQVQLALDEAMRDRTVLVIAHRLSTIRNADQIVVLEHGRVIEQGPWSELAAKDGVFARLLQLNALAT
jgi:ABC-type multidrug transport system fused ATPase/permease subunit